MNSLSSCQDVDMLNAESQTSRHDCRWDFCRLTFLNRDLLYNHILAEHIRRAIPVRRRDIPLHIRAEEGLGQSLQISDLMRDSSASTSTPQTNSTQAVQAFEEHPSSSLPSPPASSPLTQPPHEPENDAGSFSSAPIQGLEVQNHNPTFMSLVSPQGSVASLQIPASPTLSSLIRGPLKRKAGPGSVDGLPSKYPRQGEIVQPSGSFNSSTSQIIVAQQLTQNVISDEEDEDYNPYDTSDSDTSSDTSSEDDHKSPTPGPSTEPRPVSPSTPALLTNTQNGADLYKAELDWPESQASSSQIPGFSLPATQSQLPLHIHESLSQPPSQLAVPPVLQQGPEPRRPAHIQTGADISISFSQNSPAAVASPTFMASTPTRQNWYQPSTFIRRKSSKAVAGGSSGGSTPKESPPEQHAIIIPSQSPISQTKSQSSRSSQKPPSKRMGFQSGNLASARASFSPKKPTTAVPQAVTEPLSKSLQSLPSEPAPPSFLVNGGKAAALMQKIVDTHRSIEAPPEVAQSQHLPSSQFSDFNHSYPEIQTQARYPSPSLSQLD